MRATHGERPAARTGDGAIRAQGRQGLANGAAGNAVSADQVVLGRQEPAGRKLNFLLQEMNRESNTIGSKAQETPIAREVIGLKEEIERIREQVQNFE